MRKGIYAVYQGVEYEAGLMDSNVISLHSHNSEDVSKGFSLSKWGIYTKRVQKNELDEVYLISSHAVYQGYTFGVYREEEDRLLLFVNGDYTAYKKFDMKIVDRGVYEKWVNKSDITSVYERKQPL